MPNPVGIVYGCLCNVTAELSSCNTDHMAHKTQNIYHLALFRKRSLSTRAPNGEGP